MVQACEIQTLMDHVQTVGGVSGKLGVLSENNIGFTSVAAENKLDLMGLTATNGTYDTARLRRPDRCRTTRLSDRTTILQDSDHDQASDE